MDLFKISEAVEYSTASEYSIEKSYTDFGQNHEKSHFLEIYHLKCTFDPCIENYVFFLSNIDSFELYQTISWRHPHPLSSVWRFFCQKTINNQIVNTKF